MFRIIKYYLLRPLVLWLTIFVMFKSLFLLFHWNYISEESFWEILKTFRISLRLDISSTIYILILPLLFSIAQFFFATNKIKKLNKYYHLIILGIVSLINVMDIAVFEYWGSKISLKSFLFLNTPVQIVATVGWFKFFMLVVFVIFHFYVGKSLLEKYYFNLKFSFKKSNIGFVVFLILSSSLMLIAIRGGLQEVPVNQSASFFSKNNTLNIAGVNPLWNFGNVFVQNFDIKKDTYVKFNNSEAKEIVKNLYSIKKDTTIKLFNIDKPNIVYVALEGVNANVFKTINNDKTYAPNIENLFSEGYLFTDMYSSGFRSDQGMVSIFSGFPPTPVNSICAQPEKFVNLPSLPNLMQDENYDFSFFHGGDAAFGNFKSYLVYNKFSISELKDYPNKLATQNLGVPDEFLFEKFSKEMVNPKEPFFSIIFTLTTHEPYDMPFNENENDVTKQYLNTVEYVDNVIGDWYNDMKKMPWFDNTIFIISSDHAHRHPGNYSGFENKRFHIPFLILGEPLKNEFKGKINSKICSQVDIPKTILKQLDLETSDFKWSKDLMNPYENEFAFYTFVNGSCLKTKEETCGWDYSWDRPLEKGTNKKLNQAFMQVLFDDYMNY